LRWVLAKAQDELAIEHAARIKLEEKIKPRSQSEIQRKELSAITQTKNMFRAIFDSNMGDNESIKFSDEIEECLKHAGWKIEPSTMSMHSGPVSGLQIQYPIGNLEYEKMAKTIFEKLKGFGFLTRIDPGNNKDIMVFIVGSSNKDVSW
jgi:hypothetical protein